MPLLPATKPHDKNLRYSPNMWAEICVDSGIERTVTGWYKAVACISIFYHPWHLSPSAVHFRFGKHVVLREGVITVDLPAPGGHSLALEYRVLKTCVPFLLGLDPYGDKVYASSLVAIRYHQQSRNGASHGPMLSVTPF